MNYYEFRRETQRCDHCQWSGPGADTRLSESFSELAEYACPQCGQKIAVVAHPTIAESKANWNDVTPLDRLGVGLIEAAQRNFAARSLKTPDQLPPIDLRAFTLLWDDDGREVSVDTVIRLGDRVIWQEPAIYEGYRRFDAVAAILRARYGAAFQDLEPTGRSEMDLYGDKLSAPDSVIQTRNELRASAIPPLPPVKD